MPESSEKVLAIVPPVRCFDAVHKQTPKRGSIIGNICWPKGWGRDRERPSADKHQHISCAAMANRVCARLRDAGSCPSTAEVLGRPQKEATILGAVACCFVALAGGEERTPRASPIFLSPLTMGAARVSPPEYGPGPCGRRRSINICGLTDSTSCLIYYRNPSRPVPTGEPPVWPCQKTGDNKWRRMVCPGSDTTFHLACPSLAVSSLKVQDKHTASDRLPGNSVGALLLPSLPPLTQGRMDKGKHHVGVGLLASSLTPAWQAAQAKVSQSQQMCF